MSFLLFADESGLKLSGYYKVFSTGYKVPWVWFEGKRQAGDVIGAANNHLRLKLSANPNSWLHVEAAYDFAPRIQDSSLFKSDLFYEAIDPFSYRAVDFEARMYPKKSQEAKSFGIFHNLDRFLVTIKAKKFDVLIGRQPIAWGSARFSNPTDVISPYAFNELDTEDRRGVDAVRVRVPLGMMDELDFGYIIGKDFKFKASAFYLKGKFNVLKTDISTILMGFRENLLVGLDFARSIGGAGSWLEAAYVVPDFFVKDKDSILLEKEYRENYFRLSFGMDYNFTGTFYGFFEYHFNSLGKVRAKDYSGLFKTVGFSEGSVYLMGKHYLNLGVTAQVTPLLSCSGMAVLNIGDGSLTFSPFGEYNIAENIYLAAGAYIGIGKHSRVYQVLPGVMQSVFRSEFGAYPAMVYTSFRLYF